MSRKIGFGLAVLMVILACGASRLEGIAPAPHPCSDNSYAQTMPPDESKAQDQTSGLQFIDVAAGWGHTCAVTGDGGVYCWGNNEYSQLGGDAPQNRNLPVRIGELSNVWKITAGWAHTCALTYNGGVKCWGYNQHGELGGGNYAASDTPVDVIGLDSGVTSIAAGDFHTCAVSLERGVKCWGNNKFGQLGDGTLTSSSVPVQAGDIGGYASAVAAGWGHTCVLFSGGTVQCWGNNADGQVGSDPIGGIIPAPVDIAGLDTHSSQISADGSHTCVLTAQKGLLCWGGNTQGELGDSASERTSLPVSVGGLGAGIVGIAAGWNQTCAINAGGVLKCWGWNLFGQLGDGTNISRAMPGDVLGLGGRVVSADVGWAHVCAIREDGGLTCWGNNVYGQLGDGTQTDSTLPRMVIGNSSSEVFADPADTDSQSGSTPTVTAGHEGTRAPFFPTQKKNPRVMPTSTPTRLSRTRTPLTPIPGC
jgi:alpha-tubulin suppressor-like RCC1 family protein